MYNKYQIVIGIRGLVATKSLICKHDTEMRMKMTEKKMGYDKPHMCGFCMNEMKYQGSGKYKCDFCGHEELDDFGKVKEFLEIHGSAPSYKISLMTGVRQEVINLFLKRGMVELPEDSDYYLKCEKCGCSIRYGRFCPDCAKKLASGIQALFGAEVGEKPKEIQREKKDRMHYL